MVPPSTPDPPVPASPPEAPTPVARWLQPTSTRLRRWLTGLGAVTVAYVGLVLMVWLAGATPRGGIGFMLVSVGVGLGLANLVGLFALTAEIDPQAAWPGLGRRRR